MNNIRYKFVKKGSIVNINSDNELLKPKKNRFFLDVGNSLDFTNGLIDNHHFNSSKYDKKTEFKSIATVIYKHEKEIKDYIKSMENIDFTEIIVHEEPDIDCITSAYIIQKYLKDEVIPEDMKILIECVEKIDSGKMQIEKGKPLNPCFILYAISEIAIRENKNNNLNSDEYIMEKGLKLIDFIVNELKLLSKDNKSLENIDVSKNDLFSEELKLFQDDYNKYILELNNPEICEKTKIKLPLLNNDKNDIKEVDALFWNKVPECMLHKYWARQDETAPLGEGYICTFIPTQIMEDASCNRHDEKRNELFKDIKTCKVIISVNPDSDVCLKGLGELLERGEREKEVQVFGSYPHIWRSRKRARFWEEWCDNEDPWYDGRNSDFTIVDAPSSGSLMTIEEIRHIFNNFKVPIVEGNLIRYTIPISFEENDFEQLCNLFNNEGKKYSDDTKNEVGKFFNTYIQNYLFECRQDNESKNNCNKYFFDKKFIYNLNSTDNKNSINAFVDKFDVILFKYGTGFIYFDIKMNPENYNYQLYFDDILQINKTIFDEQENIFNRIVNEVKLAKYKIQKSKIMIFSAVSIKSNLFCEYNHKEMVYKLMNFMDWKGFNYNSRYMEYLSNEDILKTDKNTFYGFSKNGGVMLIVDDNYECTIHKGCSKCITKNLSLKQMCVHEKNNELINKYFADIDFYIFILALQQRANLLNFSYKLSLYDNKRKQKDIQKLRSLLINFTTQSWFTEITEDKIGTELYKRWMKVFENKELYQEVFEQLSTVDDYNKAIMSSKFTLASAVTFPVVIIGAISSIFTTGYLKGSGEAFSCQWIPTKDTVMGALNIGWLWLVLLFAAIIAINVAVFFRKE